MNSLILTEKSTVTFQIGTDFSTTATLDSGTAIFAPPLAAVFQGVVTWTLETDPNNIIEGHEVAVALNDISIPAATAVYAIPDAASGSITGSKIAKATVSGEIPLCAADGTLFSATGDAHYVQDGVEYYLSGGTSPGEGYVCTCLFDPVQTKVSGKIS